jgi:phosphatidylserine/phosphatidylglycerophosphate/cardiolipin synthase-like enzyme
MYQQGPNAPGRDGASEMPPAGDENAEEPRLQLLDARRNCWRVARAARIAVHTNSEYFRALAASMLRARRRILILGWKFDPLAVLDPESDGTAGMPLARFLHHLLTAEPELEIRILLWDRTIFYGGNGLAPRLLTELRDSCPRFDVRFASAGVFASRHQKLVCIDDSLAFIGGIDLTGDRWDHNDHPPFHPRRVTPDGHRYGPIHDLQLAVEGDAAAALAEVARAEWREAGGGDLPPCEMIWPSAWPSGAAADFTDVPAGIARTDPAAGIREVETLYWDALMAARHTIYIEAQYLTSAVVGAALARRLAEPAGPEIVVIVTRTSNGRLERLAMGTNRDRLARRLRAADRRNRLRIYHPVVGGEADGTELKVHAKLLVIDDWFLRVGSSNLNNRSMGLDTECDLGIEGLDAASRRQIVIVRNRMLAELLHCSAGEVGRAIARTGSLIAAIEMLNTGRRLRPLPALSETSPARPMLGTSLLDADEKMTPAYLWRVLRRSVGLGARPHAAGQLHPAE